MFEKEKLKGYQFADGVHWQYDGKEIAIINEATREIEWCVRTFTLPDELVEAVRNTRTNSGTWIVEVTRSRPSVTQGYICVLINGNCIASYEDEIQLLKDGTWDSTIPDEDLGKYAADAIRKHLNPFNFISSGKNTISICDSLLKVKYEECYESDEYKTITYYYMCEKELLNKVAPGEYPDAVSMELSIEIPIKTEIPVGKTEAEYASVRFSPTNADGEDYDWNDLELHNEEVEVLLRMAE